MQAGKALTKRRKTTERILLRKSIPMMIPMDLAMTGPISTEVETDWPLLRAWLAKSEMKELPEKHM